MTERRKAYRYALNLPVRIRSSAETGFEYRTGRTRDISTRGVYVLVVDSRLDSGAEVDLTITLPTEVTGASEVVVRAVGTVVRLENASEADESPDGVAAAIERYDIVRQQDTASA